jgi:tetratricopeptide (TPR) repeat protein
MSSTDDLIELELIEALDELSNKVQEARASVRNENPASTVAMVRMNSVQNVTGLKLADVLDENDDELEDPNVQVFKDVLDSLQDLCDALFSTKKFLAYTGSLNEVVTALQKDQQRQLQAYDRSKLLLFQSLVKLMNHTVDNHNQHPCMELRYVTLLELLRSHQTPRDWEPSVDINTQWKRLSCQVEHGVEPEQFQRQAYQVLVSLPWVPSSCELYAACSYEESEALASWDDLPMCLRARLEQIPEPLMRSDAVFHILHKIRGLVSFTVTISSKTFDNNVEGKASFAGKGDGKTTLATLLAANPTISDNFTVFWIDLKEERLSDAIFDPKSKIDDAKTVSSVPLTHPQYMQCLQRLCIQLGASQNWPNLVMRLENAQLRQLREKEHMTLAKKCMGNLLENVEGKFLIVLDGVNDEADFTWFNFLEGQSSIVVTTNPDVSIPGVTYAMEVGALGTDEAIQLFASESSHDRQHIIFQTNEAKTIVTQCLHHPLIVRTAARWFKMKQATAGLRRGLEELKLELNMLKSSRSDTFKVFTGVMNMMLSPTKRGGGDGTKIMKLCLASVATVFGNAAVPIDAVLALWSEVFVTHPDAIQEVSDGLPDSELYKRVWYFMEVFMHLGIFALSDDGGVLVVKLYHGLYLRYGLNMVLEVAKNKNVEDTKAIWHGAFVDGYNKRRKRLIAAREIEDKCRTYALRRLLHHLAEAKAIPKVLDLLKDENWCRERLIKFGWFEGTKLHIDDCKHLRQKALASNSATSAETKKVVLSCLKKMSSILSEDTSNLTDTSRVEKAMALHLVGFTLADNGGVGDALTQYKTGMTLMTNPAHPLNAIITYSQAVLHLMRNDHDKAFKKLKACLKVLRENDVSHQALSALLQEEAVQLKGDALLASCDYSGAEESYEEALDLMNNNCPIETSNALFRRGVLHHIMGERDQALSAVNECINVKLEAGETCSSGLSTAYSRIGDLFMEFNENEEALKNYQHALDIAEELDDEGNEYPILLLNGKISFLKNDADGFAKCCDRAREEVKESPRLYQDQSASDLRFIGKLYAQSEKPKEAIEIFRESLVLTKDRLDSLERASTLLELGHTLIVLNEPKEAISCLEASLAIRKRKLKDCEMVLDTQIAIGNILRQLEMHNECLAVSKEVMYLTEKLFKGNDQKAASALYGVAESHEVLGHYEQAIALYEKCNELLKKALCNDHPNVAKCLQKLATVHGLRGDYEKAFGASTMALRICQANFEPDHPQLAETFYTTGVIARKRNDYESARQHLQDALRIQKKLKMASETSFSLIELGNVHRLVKEEEIALDCYERCLEVLKNDGCNPHILSSLYMAMGHAKLSMKENQDAIDCFDIALRNRIELYGRDHSQTALASRSMGVVKYVTESFAESIIYLGDFVRVMEKEKTVDSIDYVLAQMLLGQMRALESRADEALKAWTNANSVLEEHPNIVNRVHGLKQLIEQVIESTQSKQNVAQEQKSFFSRFAEMAKLEEEVSADLPIEGKIQEILCNFVFLDEN